MKRNLEQVLVSWKQEIHRLPLLFRGARQVGKSYLIETFGKKYFQNTVSINFELRPEYKTCFKTLVPVDILKTLSVLSKQEITPGQTLLFLDEIQECPQAIMALRYFKELYPELHVIGAGSLLEFALKDENFRMPVGRVQFVFLKPLSFQEFLEALDNKPLLQFLKEVTLKTSIPEAIHLSLQKCIREYMVLGGMPAVLQSYQEQPDFNRCQNLQTVLLSTYRNDFGKYASLANHKYLQMVFEKTPLLIGQAIKYVQFDPHFRARELKSAISILHQAGVIYPIYASSASGIPLNTLMNEKKFKLLFLDTGLVKRTAQLEAETLLKEDLILINRGSLAEQFVGQELLAYGDPYQDNTLFFWHREKIGGLAEVDFVMTFEGHIIPIEVKAGTTGRLKSLHLFMEEKKSPIGIRISQKPIDLGNKILSLPFYLIGELPRLVKEAIAVLSAAP